MRTRPAWLLCLLLCGLVLRGAARKGPEHSMETRTPGIDPAWYAGRGFRPVGRFGRRGTLRRALPSLVLDPGRPASPWKAPRAPAKGDGPDLWRK